MPLLLGSLVTLFIWFGENIGTFSAVWLYPRQVTEWGMVHAAKIGSWLLLLLISYSLVVTIHRPAAMHSAGN